MRVLRAATAPPVSMNSWTWTRTRGCRSTRRTACTARPATSRIRRRTASGSRRRAAAGRTTRTCKARLLQDAGEGAPANAIARFGLFGEEIRHRGDDLLEDLVHLLVGKLGRHADIADEEAAVAVAARAAVRHV